LATKVSLLHQAIKHVTMNALSNLDFLKHLEKRFKIWPDTGSFKTEA
jgi:hypothetical protein